MTRVAGERGTPQVRPLPVAEAATMSGGQVLAALHTTDRGLSRQEAAERLRVFGPNAVRTHRVRTVVVLLRQVRSPLLILLAVTALASFFLGERLDAVIIAVILLASVGLGFVNEYRAERAVRALHEQIRHRALVIREGEPGLVDVADLVPGDIVQLNLGDVVPADARVLSATALQCEESVLTGESVPVDKTAESGCVLMGTVVCAGSGHAVVAATGGATQFGQIALGLGQEQPPTEFQIGLRRFSTLLVQVGAVLTVAIFAVNLVLHRPLLEALLFSLAIAVGISPQLLPAVVSTSLATGSHQLARRKVLIKRLVCIEDLGDVEVLFTDKTGTLTEGRTTFMRALDPAGRPSSVALVPALVCTEAVLGDGRIVQANPLDAALWNSPATERAQQSATRWRRLAILPFEHERRLVSALADDEAGQRLIIVKGAPEAVLGRCADVTAAATAALTAEFQAGHRIIAVAVKPAPGAATLSAADECDLSLLGFLVSLDPPKTDAKDALNRLAGLGITVKVITGDNPRVAEHVCAQLGLPGGGTLTGADLERMDDPQLAAAIGATSIFARVGPAQKARIVRLHRTSGLDVAFLGDGVNDALALHAADVGIAVEGGTEVAKDAADVVLLEKSLDVLADGVVTGRRIFANTMKYVLMGTSSNFGNMFSAAGASAFLGFLPMLPSQILLNNLLYDTSQLAIPTDTVDPEQLARPARWDVGLIRRFMLFFGPISSLFDFATFAVMLWVFAAGPPLFRSGWFVESLATQTLVIFVIRTKRVPFTRSHPSVPLLVAALGVVTIGAILPATPLAATLGFSPLPGGFFLALVAMVVTYLALIEVGKRWFFRTAPAVPPTRPRRPGHRTHRRAARFKTTAVGRGTR